MGDTTAVTIKTVLDNITSVVTEGATEWLPSAANAVTSSPVAMVVFGISLVGIGFGLFRRLMSVF